jgi:hypothetical protein
VLNNNVEYTVNRKKTTQQVGMKVYEDLPTLFTATYEYSTVAYHLLYHDNLLKHHLTKYTAKNNRLYQDYFTVLGMNSRPFTVSWQSTIRTTILSTAKNSRSHQEVY